MAKLITQTKIHGNNLRRYGFKIGDKVETSLGIATITGICEIESHVNSFEFDKDAVYTKIMIVLENGTECNVAPTTIEKYYAPAKLTEATLGDWFN